MLAHQAIRMIYSNRKEDSVAMQNTRTSLQRENPQDSLKMSLGDREVLNGIPVYDQRGVSLEEQNGEDLALETLREFNRKRRELAKFRPTPSKE